MTGARPEDTAARDEAVFAAIQAAVLAGDPCPTNEQLAIAAGYAHRRNAMASVERLERADRIAVKRYQDCRVVTIVATGARTALPDKVVAGKAAPHHGRSPSALARQARTRADGTGRYGNIDGLFKDLGPRPRTCMWPMWGDKDPPPRPATFCGAPRDADPDYDGCYCSEHRERSRGGPAAVIVHHHRSKAGAML